MGRKCIWWHCNWQCIDQVAPAANSKKGSLLIPEEEVARVMKEVAVQPGPTGLQKLAGIKNIVEGWCVPCPHLNLSPLKPCRVQT